MVSLLCLMSLAGTALSSESVTIDISKTAEMVHADCGPSDQTPRPRAVVAIELLEGSPMVDAVASDIVQSCKLGGCRRGGDQKTAESGQPMGAVCGTRSTHKIVPGSKYGT